ncbi:ATP-binding protein [Aerosakkonema funiforme]|uniref:ATP-binding protein n=1 Tax=Aerosakkonema funiforme TaxID=1246630 RepID=UPI0035B878F2
MPIHTLNRVVSKVSGKATLQTILIVPFVVQIVGAVGLVGYLSFKNGQQAVNDVASQLRREISDRTFDRISTYLTTPHPINLTNANAIRLGQLDINNPQALQRHFLKQIQVFNSLSRIYFSNPQGGLVSVGNDERGLTVASTESFTKGLLRVYSVDSQGNRQKLLVNQPQYDARKRPFYQTAVTVGKPTWGPIYIYIPTSRGLGIAASYPLYNEAGKLQGVLSSDLSLTAINNFLKSLKIGIHGEAFIIERSGMIVASSSSELPFIKDADGKENKRLQAVEMRNPLIRSTAQHLIYKFSNLTEINSSIQLEFQMEGKREFAQVTPFKDGFGLDWLIVVVVPEADFMQQINTNTQTTILLCIAAFILATGIGIFTAAWITKPILRLNTAAKEIAKGEWHKTLEIKRSDEVGQLAESFNQMAEQLEASFAALRDSENRLTQFLEGLPVGVSVHDPTGNATYANQRARQILEMDYLPETKTEQLAHTYRVYLSGTDLPYPTKKLPVVKALAGESSTIDDMEVHRPNGIIPLQVWATPIYDRTNQVVYAIAAFTDISERKQAENLLAQYNRTLEIQVAERTAELTQSNQKLQREIAERKRIEVELQQAKEAAEAASQAKSTFFANMSHELRSPLNAILGFAQLMLRSSTLLPEDREKTRIIYRSGEHLLTLINDVLDMAKIESGRISLNETAFDVIALLNDLRNMFYLKAQEKRLYFQIECSADIPQMVLTDEVKLRQVLINLLSNAFKFTSSGSVSLRLSLEPKQNIIINNKKLALHFEISDTGCGVAANELDSIFQPFVQTKSGQKVEGGTGLGLPISRHFVQMMGGEMTVESEVNKGTNFKFYIQCLPVAIANRETSKIAGQVIALAPNQPSYRILIADDRSENRQLFAEMLQKLGFSVQVASNGMEAVKIWENWQPELIFMDVHMPVMNGHAAVQHIRSQESEKRKGEKLKRVIIVAVSASSFDTDRETARRAGYDEFIPKPFTERDIFEIISRYLGVLYIYEESGWTASSKVLDFNIDIPAAIAALPTDLMLRLEQATISLDSISIESIIEEISTHDRALADALRALVNNFNHYTILNLIEEAKSQK